MANEERPKGRGEYQIDEITYSKTGLLETRRYECQWEEVEKSVIRYVRTKWMAPNTGLARYTRASPPARKVSLFTSIIITIILSYATIRIYTISHM